MKRFIILLYGMGCYAISVLTLLYALGFLTNLFVPKSIDAPVTRAPTEAFFINLGLLSLFAVQHSVMARPFFKRWCIQWIPAAAERSSYVLLSSGALMLLFRTWQPMGGIIWQLDSLSGQISLWTLNALGWTTIVITTFLIHHAEMFGLRQVWLFWQAKSHTALHFTTPGFYQWVRHPLYVGWLLVFWAAPTMTTSRLMFASLLTVYILAAIRWEEKDLVDIHGTSYEQYQRRVPMLLPGRRKSGLS